jgi:L-malate glycosyltransferase
MTVARMTYPAKGHDDLLEAVPAVRRAVGPVRFLIVGDGPREPMLRRAAERQGTGDALVFLGRRADVPALLARTDLVCHPARMEGLPNAVMEAMAASRPIVATAVGGTPELIQDGVHGLLVPPEDPGALAVALIKLLADRDLRARLGRAARERIAAQYSLPQLIERIDRLYAEMTGRLPLVGAGVAAT